MTSKTTTFILSLFGEDTIADEKAAKTFPLFKKKKNNEEEKRTLVYMLYVYETGHYQK